MSFKRDQMIDVYNYNQHVVCTKANTYEYSFPPADGNEPSVIPMPYGDIEYINQTSKAFKDGMLRFAPEEEAELYEALRIHNWEHIYTLPQITDMIINASVEDAQEIINIKSLGVISVFKGELCRLINAGYDVSVKIQRIINQRYSELIKGITQSDIVIGNQQDNVKSESYNDLKNQVSALQEMVAKLMSVQTAMSNTTVVSEEKVSDTVETTEEVVTQEKKPVKRTTKTKTK